MIWTSFATYITRTSTKNNFASNCAWMNTFSLFVFGIIKTHLLDANFDVVTADGGMNIFHVKEYFVTRPGAAIANLASGRTSPVHSHHSFNECYIG